MLIKISSFECVMCGGSWFSLADYSRVVNRYNISPDYHNYNSGFRISRRCINVSKD